jgi:maltodextrin utilization protein YvdJ
MVNEDLVIAIFFALWVGIFVFGSLYLWVTTTKEIAKNPDKKHKLNEDMEFLINCLAWLPVIVFLAVPVLIVAGIEWCSEKIQNKYIEKLRKGGA